MRTILAAAAAALLLTLGVSTPAVAATSQARVSIEADDLVGVGVPGVVFTVTSGSATVTVTSNTYGDATARVAVTPGDTVVVSTTDSRVTGLPKTFTSVDSGDRLTATATVGIAQGYTIVWAQSDLDGDTVYDTIWHKPQVGVNDRWVVQLSTGPVQTDRFASGTVVDIYTTDFTSDPANELVAIEQLASGEYRAWVYSELAGQEQRINLGAMPTLWHLFDDFDGDGLRDILYYSDGSSGAYQFTLVLSSTQRALKFSAGSPGAFFFEETTDVTGDGIDDIVLGEGMLGSTTRWWVWESDDRTVHTVDVGTIGGQPGVEGFSDGDGDGLREFIMVSDLPGDDRLWEVYEYATGDYFTVVLGPEDDRGPSPEHYPADWFD